MKKILIIMFLLIILANITYGVSNDFEKTIIIMGINRYNNQGHEINEQIYNKYNQIVYGSPELAIKEPTQRWKNVLNGKWFRNEEKGEYRILGYNYSGKVINNHDFPEDIIPSSSPENWKYVELYDALSSWNNINLYKFIEQKQYMQNTNLIRNSIQYNLTCNKIGLNRTRVESYSTLNNNGTIYTNRFDSYGKKWEATFLTSPMNTNMKYEVLINSQTDIYTIKKGEQYIQIPITITTELNSSSDLITDKFIKETHNEIFLNNEFEKETVCYSKLKNIETVILKVSRELYNNIAGTHELCIDVTSKTYTQFKEDVPFYGKNSKVISIIIEDNSKEEVPEDVVDDTYTEDDKDTYKNNSNITLSKKEIINNRVQFKELYRTKSTNYSNSQGFLCAGNILGIKVKANKNTYKVKMSFLGDKSIKEFDDLTKQFEWDEPIIRGNKTKYNKLNDYINFYNQTEYLLEPQYSTSNVYLFEYLIPYNAKQTLHSWNSIREQTGESLNTNENMVMNRIRDTYTLKFEIYNLIKKKNKDGTITTYTQKETEYASFDVFERWNNLYNRNIIKYVLNKQPSIIDEMGNI